MIRRANGFSVGDLSCLAIHHDHADLSMHSHINNAVIPFMDTAGTNDLGMPLMNENRCYVKKDLLHYHASMNSTGVAPPPFITFSRT